MEVSSFELIYKPQSPSGTADIVLQGYFLNITNLENKDLLFGVDFITSSVTDPNRSLAANTIAFIDRPNTNNIPASLIGALADPSFRLSPSVRVAPNETAKIAVLPADPFNMPGGPVNFEARGYVKLRLPARFVFNGRFFELQPQLDRPAKVLLTPQNRATYFDTAGNIKDQTQSSLPTASGAALATVKPEDGRIQVIEEKLTAELQQLDDTEFTPLSEEQIATLLGAVATSGMEFGEVNRALKNAGFGMALEKRKI